jgi:hypothetical protein
VYENFSKRVKGQHSSKKRHASNKNKARLENNPFKFHLGIVKGKVKVRLSHSARSVQSSVEET